MKNSGKYKRGEEADKIHVLCIFTRNHDRSEIVLDHVRNFKDI